MPKPLNSESIQIAKSFTNRNKTKINLSRDKTGIYVKARVCTAKETAEAIVERAHDNLSSLRFNEKPVQHHPLLSGSSEDEHSISSLENFLKKQSLENLLTLVERLDDDDYEFIQKGIQYNVDLAEHGLTFGDGLGVGKTLDQLAREGLICRDMVLEAKILTSAASDARMSGVKLPAMSSAGSGNHGLTAILPVWAVKNYITCPEEKKVLQAMALSHVITGYIKSHTGRLSAVCGCSVAAGAGAAAGITYLMGGSLFHIAGAIKNLISDLAGVICDGAKLSCSFKLATAAETAVQSALFALHGLNVKETDGIIALTPEQTMKNIGEISTEGMIETDRTILNIMINKQFDN